MVRFGLLTLLLVFFLAELAAQVATFTVDGPNAVITGEVFEGTVIADFPGPGECQGYAYGICHDPLHIELLSVTDGDVPLTANDGEIVDSSVIAVFPDGYVVGVVINLNGSNPLPPGSGYELTIGSYQALSTTTATAIDPCATLGVPPVILDWVVAGGSNVPETAPLDLAIFSQADPPFRRGDVNHDAQIDLADGIHLLSELFLGEDPLPCEAARDASNDGVIDLADAMIILQHLFADGQPPAAPFPVCGPDYPGLCVEYGAC